MPRELWTQSTCTQTPPLTLTLTRWGSNQSRIAFLPKILLSRATTPLGSVPSVSSAAGPRPRARAREVGDQQSGVIGRTVPRAPPARRLPGPGRERRGARAPLVSDRTYYFLSLDFRWTTRLDSTRGLLFCQETRGKNGRRRGGDVSALLLLPRRRRPTAFRYVPFLSLSTPCNSRPPRSGHASRAANLPGLCSFFSVLV